jgi:hypothetical protein
MATFSKGKAWILSQTQITAPTKVSRHKPEKLLKTPKLLSESRNHLEKVGEDKLRSFQGREKDMAIYRLSSPNRWIEPKHRKFPPFS